MFRIKIHIHILLFFVLLLISKALSFGNENSRINRINISDTIIVNLQTNAMFSYQSYLYTDSTLYYAAFNQVNKNIYIYNVSDSFKLYSKYSIPESIAGKFEDIREVYFYSLDSMFVFLNDRIFIFNYIGDLKSIIELNDRLQQYPYVVGDLYKSYPSFLKDGKLYTFQLHNSGPQNFKFFKYPLECQIDLSNVQLKSNNVFYSPLLKKNMYGLVRNAVKISHDSLGIMSFFNDPNLYVYNYNSLLTDTINCKSKLQSFEIKPLKKKYIADKEVQYKHYQFTPWYTTMYWDPFRKIYYRFFLNGILEKNESGLYNTFADRQLIMIILDKNFSILYEQTIGSFSVYGVGKVYITKDAVCLQAKAKDEGLDKLVLHKIEFN